MKHLPAVPFPARKMKTSTVRKMNRTLKLRSCSAAEHQSSVANVPRSCRPPSLRNPPPISSVVGIIGAHRYAPLLALPLMSSASSLAMSGCPYQLSMLPSAPLLLSAIARRPSPTLRSSPPISCLDQPSTLSLRCAHLVHAIFSTPARWRITHHRRPAALHQSAPWIIQVCRPAPHISRARGRIIC